MALATQLGIGALLGVIVSSLLQILQQYLQRRHDAHLAAESQRLAGLERFRERCLDLLVAANNLDTSAYIDLTTMPSLSSDSPRDMTQDEKTVYQSLRLELRLRYLAVALGGPDAAHSAAKKLNDTYQEVFTFARKARGSYANCPSAEDIEQKIEDLVDAKKHFTDVCRKEMGHL